MKAYPIGTPLVITWADSEQARLGVSVGMTCLPMAEVTQHRSAFSGELCQPVQITDSDLHGWHPLAWMRPISDPDAETQDSDADLEVTA